ncbi:hypothetical protein DXG01_005344 [Tephrocybe rancida]|nr:hypothetical protein DXG01_005344 [Tephrocybe rancida]
MSLLTPPSTAHRRAKDKEISRDIDSNSRVVWAETDKIHILQLPGPAASTFKVTTGASASKRPPNRSILKKCVGLVPWPQEKQREVTPEPVDPMGDSNYLAYPVTTIVGATDATELRVLIEAYSILTARLRAAVTSTTDADPSWALFYPLRKHTEEFTDAVVRDLGRALEDPAASRETEEPIRILLPSPTNTPVKKKKRDGMSAEQVKYARDLCTTSHAVIRLLSLVFTLPAITNVFKDKQLRSMFTAMLAIPLADDLPTPNARKTWALAIWLIQTQRLSAAVLTPAADRIALALCRGIDGELGKEGKKGSASDGLKAIHDLSVHLPSVFVPAFTHSLLPSVLMSLLAPTLALRTHAAHALGGFVIGATSLPNAPIHSEISSIVLKYITTLPPPRSPSASPTKQASPLKLSTPAKKPGFTPQTPTKPQEPSIVRTLRTTLQATDPPHVAHGPVWAICVLSALLVLLGPAAMRVSHLRVLVQLGMRHKNRNVRALNAAMWRCIVWVYIRPRFITAEDEDGEDEVDEREMEKEVKVRDEWWKVVASVVEFETGVCAIAATIGSGNVGVPVYDAGQWVDTRLSAEDREEQPLRRALDLLYAMATKDTPTRESAVDALKALLGLPQSHEALQTAMEHEADERTLVPRSLFSAFPGLLTVDYGALKASVTAVFDETPKAEDVRRLTREEIGKVWVWEGVVKAWRAAVGGGRGEDGERERKALLHVWEGMVGMGLGAAFDPEDEDSVPSIDEAGSPSPQDQGRVSEFNHRAVAVIIEHVLEDTDLNLQPASSPLTIDGFKRTGSTSLEIPGFSSSPKSSIAKLSLAREMWSAICRLVPHATLESAAEQLAQCLMKTVEEYTTFGNSTSRDNTEEEDDDNKEMNEAWTELCVDVLAACGSDSVRAFWEAEGGKGVPGWKALDKALVWRVYSRGWVMQSTDAGWIGAVCALAAPFRGRETWVLTTEDAEAWQKLLDFAVRASQDLGNDSNEVLGAVAGLVADDSDAVHMPLQIRLVEFIFNYLAKTATNGDLRELPEAVLEFAATIMSAAYPPPKDQTTYTWTVRALTSLIDQCPHELMGALGESMTGVLAMWVGDAEDKWDKGVIEYDIIPLYETLLTTIQGWASVPLLSTFGAALCSPLIPETRTEIHGPAVDAFKEFWETYINLDVPEGGWNEDITSCLRSVYGAPTEDKAALMSELEAAFIPHPATPSTPEMVPNAPSTPCSSSSTSCYDRTALNTPSTPPRPSKSTRSFTQLLIHSPESPMPSSRLSVLSRPPTPRSSRYSPVKRRKLTNGNKENLSPVKEQFVTSVVDRILASSPSVPKVNLGKRRLEDDLYSTDSSEDERRAVEALVMPSEGIFSPPAKNLASTSKKADTHGSNFTGNATKKRKRMIMDAVEIPPLSEVYARNLRTSASFERAPTPANRQSLRRASSDTKVRDAGSENRSRKRRRGTETETELDGEDVFDIGAIPLQALVPSLTNAWTRPYSLVRQKSKRMVPSSEVSSDDDPRLGQVTPHHLISPVLKRGRDVNLVDPPSDDSMMPPSPSRDLVKRKLQRMGSGSVVKIAPFVV